MGNFLKHVGMQGDLKTVCTLINLSLAKIRELHGGFKSICDSFAINLTEFETIFASSEKMFALWDTDNNGKFFYFCLTFHGSH
jgi:microtubule-associated protein-like 5